MKPRIVLLSAFLTPFRSGAEACVEEIPQILADRFDFTIVTAKLRSDLSRRSVMNGVPVIRVGIGSNIDKWLFPFLAPFAARRLKPDIIHAVLESFAGLAMVFCRFVVPKAKRILTCQSTNTSLFVGLMHRFADRVTAISSVLISRGKAFGRSDMTLIPNGIAYQEMRHAAERVPKTPGSILFVGRLEPMKGIDTLLEAFAALQSKEARLRIVGGGSLRSELESLAHKLHVQDRVTFVGFVPVPDVFQEFAQAEIFAGLSRSEALGNVFLEAQAAGCAVVATRVGGIPDVVRDGEAGLLIPPNDPKAAALAMDRLLMHADERKRMSKNGVANAAHYDWSFIADKYARVYNDIFLARTSVAAS